MNTVIKFIFLNRVSIILLTPLVSALLVYVSMDIAMQFIRNYSYDISWFHVWFYSPKEIFTQMTYFQSININLLDKQTLRNVIMSKMVLVNTLIFSTGIGAYLFIYRYKLLKKSKSDRHGNSRWSNIDEIRKNALLNQEGIVIGRIKIGNKMHYLQHDGPEPVIGVGPTRSWKGVGWVIPSLLKWKHSSVIYDPKGENWDKTAEARRKYHNNKCLRFAPNELPNNSKYKNSRFNFLDSVKYGTLEEVSNAETIATIVCDTGDAQKDYWEEEAKTLIKAAILHIVYTKLHGNLTDVSFFIGRPPEEILDEMLNTDHAACLSHKKVPPEQVKAMIEYWGGVTNKNIKSVAESLHAMLSGKKRKLGEQFNPLDNHQSKGAEGQLQGIIGGAKRFLNLYQDPIIAHNIAQSDFKLDDIYNYDTPVSLYIVVPPSRTQQERLRPLVRLIISLILDKVQENIEEKKHRVLFLIDEFPTLKKMNDIEDAFSTVSGYGLKFFLIIQDIKQLEKYYGNNQTFYSNAHVRLIYSTADSKTKKMVSENSGNYTYIGPVISQTNSGGMWGSRSMTTSMQESSKPLVTPDQVEKLVINEMFIFIKGMNAIKCHKANYLNDPTLFAQTKNISYFSDNLSPSVANVLDNSTIPQKLKMLPSFTEYIHNKEKIL